MKTSLKMAICLLMLLTSMACAFVQNMLWPPEPESSVSTPVPTLLSDPSGDLEPITCTDDHCLQARLDRLEHVLQTRPFDLIGNSIYEEQGAELNLVIYRVNGDEITDPAILYVPPEYQKYQLDTASHLRVWEFYVAMVPSKLRTFVDEFVIFTDGPEGDTMAWVSPSSTADGFWQVGIDLLDSDYLPYLADTPVHETAHLLTLNSSHIPSDEDYYPYDKQAGKFMYCSQYAGGGGCALPGSYINLFYQEFWKDSYGEWWELEQEAQDTETFDNYLQVMERFYQKQSDWFINSYAATNVEEDMDESFSYFVLNPKPLGNSIHEQKITFYYEFPELFEYRQQMIEGLCSHIRL